VKASVLLAVGYAVWFMAGAVFQTAVMLPIGWLTAPPIKRAIRGRSPLCHCVVTGNRFGFIPW